VAAGAEDSVAVVAAVVVAVAAAARQFSERIGIMIVRLAVAALLAGLPLTASLQSASARGLDHLVGAPAEGFSSVDALVDTFKSRLAAGDRDGVARLLGLNPKELAQAEDIDRTFASVRELAAQSVRTSELAPGRQEIVLGNKLWPFPFPAVKISDKWVFATKDGLAEVLNRRIGENELEVIETVRAYVDAQETYRRTDWDEDGVRAGQGRRSRHRLLRVSLSHREGPGRQRRRRGP
jgi:hypothetical protein